VPCSGERPSGQESTGSSGPHGLRHAFASELAAEGQPLTVIRDALGHSSLATTDVYLRHISPEHVIDALRARSWMP
jgi:site-specific recombinase XerD